MKAFYLFLVQTLLVFSLHAQTGALLDSLAETKGADTIFKKVEIESSFPGGVAGWSKFLSSTLVYPPKAVRKKIEGTVVVQFIVGKDGAVTDITAISGPELLQDAAVKVIQQSPNWKAAVQYGRKVKSYKKQPITFRLTP